MTDKFVGEAQLREAFGLGVNDGVFQCAAFAKAHLSHGFEFPCESDRSCRRDFFHIGVVVNHDVSHLCAQKGMRIDRGECDAEPVIGKGCDEFVVFVDSSACIECQDRDHLILCFNACFFNHVAEGFRRAVAYGRFR